MEPLTRIDLGSCKWLGVLAVACAMAGELIALANRPHNGPAAFPGRVSLRGATRQPQIRGR